MNRRNFIKKGAIWVPSLFAIGRARGQAFTFRDPAFVRKTVAGSSCATTDTSIPHDELLEGFQTASTGYENTWVQYGTTANITAYADTSALTTGKPTGACDRAWKLVIPSDGTETYAKWTRGSGISTGTTIDTVFYVYLSALPANGKSLYILSLSGNSYDLIGRVHIYNNVGAGLIHWQASVNSNYVSFTAGEWHKITIHLDSTAANSYMQVDAGTQEAFTRNTAAGKDLREVYLMQPESLEPGDADGVSVYIDLICVNTP